MKRKAFILTELMTSMTLQAGFIIVLGSAFYMLLSFGTRTQQMLAAQDEGEIVISYVDARIRNAGLGLWKCESPAKIREAFNVSKNFSDLNKDVNNIDLPVAITSTLESDPTTATVSKKDGVYEGNVLTLLYARKDTESDRLLVLNADSSLAAMSTDIPAGIEDTDRVKFKFLDFDELKSNFDFTWPASKTMRYRNLASWAVLEATGVPVRVSDYNKNSNTYFFYINAPYRDATIYPMSELLNLECERIYADSSTNMRSLMLNTMNDNGKFNDAKPHTSGILEIYLTLDTNPSVPILDLKVLVSEGRNNSGDTPRPQQWPEKYWYEDNNNNHEDFRQHRVHVSQASWKLYNLAPFFH